MKIAIACFGIESSTFTPLRATRADLTIKYGSFVSDRILSYFQSENIELVQCMLASGSPHGVLALKDFLEIKEEIIDRIVASGPLDGIFLSMHGSMEVEEIGHGEMNFIKSLRQVVGDEILISVRLDLHGNIPEQFIQYPNIVTALRTAPHRDGVETALRACKLLVEAIRKKTKPVTEMLKVPLLLPGEFVITDSDPGRGLYAELEKSDAIPGLLSSSLMVGFAWSDRPYTSAGVIVTAESDRALARKEAQRLAEKFWSLRRKFAVDGESYSLKESIVQAKKSSILPVFLSDSGDNVTAGAPGDATAVLHAFRSHNVQDAVFAQVFDPESARKCLQIGEGGSLQLTLGAKISADHADPFECKGHVQKIWHGEPGSIVVFASEGNEILITDRRFPIIDPKIFQALGINLLARKLAVFKLGYLMPELKDMAPRSIIALTPGPTTLDVHSLRYHNLSRPIYPLDADPSFA